MHRGQKSSVFRKNRFDCNAIMWKRPQRCCKLYNHPQHTTNYNTTRIKIITTIFPRIYARTYYAHPRARVLSFSWLTRPCRVSRLPFPLRLVAGCSRGGRCSTPTTAMVVGSTMVGSVGSCASAAAWRWCHIRLGLSGFLEFMQAREMKARKLCFHSLP
jgi:hypothetical protein